MIAAMLWLALAIGGQPDLMLMADGSRVAGRLVSIDLQTVRFEEQGEAAANGRAPRSPRSCSKRRPKKGTVDSAVPKLDRIEMDGTNLDGTLLALVREADGPYGLTRAALLDAKGGLVVAITPRQLARVILCKGSEKASAIRAPATVDRTLATLKALKPESDVPAAIFGAAEAVAAVQSAAPAKERLAAAVKAASALLPEHMKRRVSLDLVEAVADQPGSSPRRRSAARLSPSKGRART